VISRSAAAAGDLRSGNARASGPALVLETTTARILRKYGEDGEAYGGELYWLGGDDPWGRDAFFVTADYACWSLGCGYELSPWGSGSSDGFAAEPVGALKGSLALDAFPDSNEVVVYRRHGPISFELPLLPMAAPRRVVTDVAHDRIFVISSGSVVAQIRNIGRKPRVTYHRVDLNGRPFEAAWAGTGKVPLWGADGLGTIDTRTWKTRALAVGVEQVVTTPFGIAAWSTNPGDGLAVYRPDGTKRFQVLVGRQIRSVQAVGGYLYAETHVRSRFSVNLRTGGVVGPLYQTGSIITPTLVSIP
jgi:hypothetical protein